MHVFVIRYYANPKIFNIARISINLYEHILGLKNQHLRSGFYFEASGAIGTLLSLRVRGFDLRSEQLIIVISPHKTFTPATHHSAFKCGGESRTECF